MATNTKSVFGYSKECVQQERCTQSKGTAATQLQWIVARTERSLVLPHCLTYFLRETRNLYFLWKSSNFFLSFQLSFQAVLVKSIIFGKLLPESQQFPSMFLKEVFTSIRVLSGYKLLTRREGFYKKTIYKNAIQVGTRVKWMRCWCKVQTLRGHQKSQ